MKHIFIINPTAGKQDSRQRIYDMAKELREKHELDVQCILTKKQGHATEIARKLCEEGGELRFYACGGDGTANEVANGILGFDNAAMTMVPVGTGNDLLKNFGGDLEKFRDVENLWDGPVFPMDVIEVNGRYALTIACSGIDARVAADVHKYSESPLLDGKSSYIVSLLVNFLFKGIGSHWKVEMDGEEMEGDWSLVSVCNGRYYGGGRGADGRRRSEHARRAEGHAAHVYPLRRAVLQGRVPQVPAPRAVLHAEGRAHHLRKARHRHLSRRGEHPRQRGHDPPRRQEAQLLRPRGLQLQRDSAVRANLTIL